ncbi:hypothetical protein GQ42DRAFT_111535, partial [Ramicandelaber brevisporus]
LSEHANSTCAAESMRYAKCIGSLLGDVQRDSCAEEFKTFKECVQKATGRR